MSYSSISWYVIPSNTHIRSFVFGYLSVHLTMFDDLRMRIRRWSHETSCSALVLAVGMQHFSKPQWFLHRFYTRPIVCVCVYNVPSTSTNTGSPKRVLGLKYEYKVMSRADKYNDSIRFIICPEYEYKRTGYDYRYGYRTYMSTDSSTKSDLCKVCCTSIFNE